MKFEEYFNINKVVGKGWGKEIWIANSPLYCGKILIVNGGKKLSWHYHKQKDETFFCLSGSAVLYYSMDDCMEDGKFVRGKAQSIDLIPGVAHHIQVGMRHQVVAEETTYLMEVSTEHFDEDSYRLEKGD